jgi:tRNA G18 (ribose-2'-O)-methylase SpoU
MRTIRVRSVNDDKLIAYVNLTELQLRNRLEPEKGLFIAESHKVIVRALAAGVQPLSFLVEESWLPDLEQTFAQVDKDWGTDIPVYVASSEQLKAITGYPLHRGALAAMRRWQLPTVEEICHDAHRIAIMENIVDPTNVGALIRSAAALDIDAVLVTPSCGDPLYRRSARVSMGTVFQVPWTRICEDNPHAWPVKGLQDIHKLGFTTAAMALQDNSLSLDELVQRIHSGNVDKLALIFGTEGDGLSAQTIENANCTVRIPMSNGVDSLNVAASSAVAFYATRPNHLN